MDNKDFEKFKKKILIEHIVYSIIYSICAGLIGAGLSTMILIFALKDKTFYPLIISLISVLFAAVCFVLVYKFKKPTDSQIALRIDSSLGMQEKIATMIEFKDKDGLIINKQRDDACEKLSNKQTKALPIKLHIWTLPVFLVCGGLFAASFFTPSSNNPYVDLYHSAVKDPTILNDKTQDIADDLKDKLDDKIDSTSTFNTEIDKIIDDLVEDLKDDTNTESREDKIDEAQSKIDDLLDEVNKNDEIGDNLSKSEDEALKALGEAIKNNDKDGIDKALADLKAELKDLSGYELANKLKDIADEIREALNDSSIPEDDPTRKALEDLADTFEQLSKQVEEETKKSEESGSSSSESDQEAKDDADKKIDETGDKLKEEADKEKDNEEAAQTAKDQLEEMKDPTDESQNNKSDQNSENSNQDPNNQGEENPSDQESEITQEGNTPGESTSDGNNTGTSGGENGGSTSHSPNDDSPGGSGDGSMNYGSNDQVYSDGEYKEYKDVIDDSDSQANKDNDNASSSDDVDDLSDLLKDYFGSLYGSDNP